MLRFLRECAPGRRDHNLIRLIGLGLYSRSSLQDLRCELKLEYDQRSRGILHFYTSESELRRAMEPARIMREAGCDRRIVGADEVVDIEPALKPIERNLAGGTFTPEDASGDAHLFSERLAERAHQAGVDFRYDTEVCERWSRSGRSRRVHKTRRDEADVIPRPGSCSRIGLGAGRNSKRGIKARWSKGRSPSASSRISRSA